mmetsp:Transcript_134751/g.349153  ORF Transcript_134751/g.349153 Transcript_134751/m.349153 type:complete len:339 (+) Transcript_134751:381-1397(+)
MGQGDGEGEHVEHANRVEVRRREVPKILHDCVRGSLAAWREGRKDYCGCLTLGPHSTGNERSIRAVRGRQCCADPSAREGEIGHARKENRDHCEEADRVVEERQPHPEDVNLVHINGQGVELPHHLCVAELPIVDLAQVAVAPSPHDRLQVAFPVLVSTFDAAPEQSKQQQRNNGVHYAHHDPVEVPGLVQVEDTSRAVLIQLEAVMTLRASATALAQRAALHAAGEAKPCLRVGKGAIRIAGRALLLWDTLEDAHEAVIRHQVITTRWALHGRIRHRAIRCHVVVAYRLQALRRPEEALLIQHRSYAASFRCLGRQCSLCSWGRCRTCSRRSFLDRP